MDIIWFLIISFMIIIVTMNVFEDCVVGGVFLMVSLVGIVIIFAATNQLNYTGIKDYLEIMIDENISDEQLRTEIENLIKNEDGNKIREMVVSVEGYKNKDVDVKKVYINVKYNVVFNWLYVESVSSFELFLKKVESGEYRTKVIGI